MVSGTGFPAPLEIHFVWGCQGRFRPATPEGEELCDGKASRNVHFSSRLMVQNIDPIGRWKV